MIFSRLCFSGGNVKFDVVAHGITMDVLNDVLSLFREDQGFVNFKIVSIFFGFFLVQDSNKFEVSSTISKLSCS